MNAYGTVAATDSFPDDDLISRNIGLVKRIAHHLAARLPANVDIDDLMQAGMVGLLEAAGNFDASRGESSLRFWAKKPSITAQKCGYPVFIKQVAAHLYKFQIMTAGRRAMGLVGMGDFEDPSEAANCNWAPSGIGGGDNDGDESTGTIPSTAAHRRGPYLRGSSFQIVS